jgi:hypothetical protein
MADVDNMIDSLRSTSRDARFRAARALVKMGPSGTAAIPQLIDALTDEWNPIADSAAWALGTMGPVAIDALRRASQSGELRRRTMAICAIGRYSSNAAMRFNAIQECSRDEDPEIQRARGYAMISLANQIGRDWQYHRDSLTTEDVQTALQLLPFVEYQSTNPSRQQYVDFARFTLQMLSQIRNDCGELPE